MKNTAITVIVLLFIMLACTRDENKLKDYQLSGFAQKGPFVVGSDVTIIELDNQLNPTGRSYYSTIEDNTGYFAFPNVTFESDYIQVNVEGVFFDEIMGGVNVTSDITLQSVTDISATSQINVNTITHLLRSRVLKLVSDGLGFNSAHEQAYNELLSIFEIDNNDLGLPENLDMTSSDYEDGVLLVISAIILAHANSNMMFQEYLTNMMTDFRDNGQIDSKVLQNSLGTGGLVIDLNEIRRNLVNKYSEMGQSINPYTSSQILKNFNDQNTFPTVYDGIFPAAVDGAVNIICEKDTLIVNQTDNYLIAINRPENSGIANIQLIIDPADASFSTPGFNWFTDEDTLRYIVEMNKTSDFQVPVEFTGSGQLRLRMAIVLYSYYDITEYPEKIIIW